MKPRRLSLRSVTLGVMVMAVAVTAILAFVLIRGAYNRSETNASVNMQVAQMSRYEDAQIAVSRLAVNLTTYYVLRDPSYVDAFERARAQVTLSLGAAQEAAPALGDAEVARTNALVSDHASILEAQERVLRALEQGDIESALRITAETGLIESSPKLALDIQLAIDDARNDLAVAQRRDTAEQRQSAALSLGIAGTWTGLLLLLGFASFRWIVRPMEKVSRGMLTIAAGDLTVRVPEGGPRELAQVGADVNWMTDALIRRSDELNAYLSRNLESRTGELEEANSALTASEARFRALVQNASDMVTIIDAEGRPIYTSPSVERIMGYASGDWMGANVISLVHPDDRARAMRSVAGLMAPGPHPPTELRVRHADGRYRYLEIVGANLLDDPAIRGIVHNSRDMTSRHEMEAALRESEARFRSLAEHSPVGIYQLSLGQEILYLNPAALAILEADELATAQEGSFERFFTAESLVTMQRGWPVDGAEFNDEVEIVGLRGARRNLLLCGAPVAEGGGEIHSFVGTMVDITERKLAEDALRLNEEKFRLLFASNPHPMWVYDLDSLKFLEVNDAAVANYGFSRAEFLHMRITDIRPEEDNERLLAVIGRTAPLMQSGEWRHCTNDGRVIDVEITSHSFGFESRAAVLVVALDITERRRVTRALADSEGRFRALVQHASDLITVIRADTTIIYQSPSVEGILGYEAPELIGHKLSEFVHPLDAGSIVTFLTQATADPTTSGTIEARLRHHDGTWRTFEIVGSNHTEDPAVGGFVLNTRDISERKILEHQLRDQAYHDALTGLANRPRFMDRLEHALERNARGANPIAVLFIDLDSFKSVNDTLGHTAGDSVLVQVGQRIQDCLRLGDTVARLGGDEFAVLAEDIGEADLAVRLAARLVAELGRPFQLDGESRINMSASIGVAFADERDRNRDLLHDADVAMYSAKTHGKNRYEVYNSDMHETMAKRLELVADLQRALETPELFLEYQPMLRLATGEIVGVEALVRWQHPRRGRIMPAEFIALAEESGLILALGHWVFVTACRQARQWEVRHRDVFVSMSVNISVCQLQHPTFVEEVAEVLRETGVNPSTIVLEVTESVMMQDVDATIAVLENLKSLGVRLAIDDFGTGYSSLSYLARYPFEILKIDKAFIDGIDAAGNELELTRAIIDLARVLGLDVVAEGIEREAQAAQLRLLKCDLVQGFLFSPPLAPAQVYEMINRTSRDLVA